MQNARDLMFVHSVQIQWRSFVGCARLVCVAAVARNQTVLNAMGEYLAKCVKDVKIAAVARPVHSVRS